MCQWVVHVLPHELWGAKALSQGPSCRILRVNGTFCVSYLVPPMTAPCSYGSHTPFRDQVFFLPSSPAGGGPHDQWCFSSSPDSSMGAVLRLRTNDDRTRPDESIFLTLDHFLSQWLVLCRGLEGGWFSVNCVRYVFRRRSRTSLSPHSRAVGLAR